MRIGIDIRSLQNDSERRGIGSYTRCLIEGLVSIGREDEYVFFAFKNRPLPALLSERVFKNVKIKRLTWRQERFVWLSGQALFPLAIQDEKLDIFHSPEYIVPVFSKSKKVITVHDFINSDYPLYRKRSGFLRRAYFYLKDGTLNCADKIIAVSEYTKRKIVELARISEDRIRVIYEAAAGSFFPSKDKERFLSLRNKYGIPYDFLLYVGALDYHKNIDGLINAFSLCRFQDIGLVLAGVKNDPQYFNFINKLIAELKIKERVYILDYIPQEDLAGLYNMSKIVISASLYEGFGLPVLEAMACGRPVIASKNTSMGEIVGTCGILVDPYNTEEIAQAINNLLSDDELRNALAEKGLQRAKEFSWGKAAQETLSLYKETAGF